MIIIFTCPELCFEHLFVLSVKEWKRYANVGYGAFGKRLDLEKIYKFETLGM